MFWDDLYASSKNIWHKKVVLIKFMLDMNNSHWRGTSTEQIRQGLERIKQAQEDVLN